MMMTYDGDDDNDDDDFSFLRRREGPDAIMIKLEDGAELAPSWPRRVCPMSRP